ncbi:AsmA-like C-terminal region-containing protein [Shimia sp. FJ5]|uniref:YhdP family protein n=1 Tax=Shimia sp. FJ5 TaxID=3079054 RepID=UPI002634728F|nr:AsmA-like C-terminal region-containing protein [Shimia sp. FJ5]MDV4145591.1 AsmA-like C-terminal region-containing protein [Shimia sp. FJ5]
MLLSLSLSAVVIALGLILLLERSLTLPDWAAEQVVEVVAREVPELDVEIGQISIVLEEDWRPRIRASAVLLQDPETGAVVEIAEIDSTLSLEALKEGRLAPSALHVSGLFLNMRRLSDGSISVALGTDAQTVDPVDRKTTLASLSRELKEGLAKPWLARLAEASLTAVTLRYEDVRAGKGWTIDGGQARLSRDEAGIDLSASLVALGARDYVTTLEVKYETSYGSDASRFGVTFEDISAEDIASQSPALAWLDILRAPISGSLRSSIDETGALGATSAALQIGAGAVQPTDTVSPIPFESAHTYLTFEPTGDTLLLDELSVQAPWVRLTANGKALLQDMELGLPGEMVVQLRLDQLEVNPNDRETIPVALDQAFADFHLDLSPFEIQLGQAVLIEGDQVLSLSGDVRTTPDNWQYAIDAQANTLDHRRVLGLWPEAFLPKLRIWIDENIHKLDLHSARVALRSQENDRPKVRADFQFRDLDMRFVKSLPDMQGAAGYASFSDNTFRVAAEKGYVTADEGGAIDATGTGFTILDTRQKPAPARVDLKASGPIPAALSLLNRPPLSAMDKANLPVTLAQGDMTASGTIELLLKKKLPKELVTFDLAGTMPAFTSDHFVKEKTIKGRATWEATNRSLTIDGSGQLGAVPFEAIWETALGPSANGRSTLQGTADIGPVAMDEFRISLPQGTVDGTAKAAFRIDFDKGEPPQMRLTSDLDGMSLAFAPLGIQKSATANGDLAVDMVLSTPPSLEKIALSGGNLNAEGSVTLKPDGTLDAADFTTFQVGAWLDGQGRLQGRGEDVPAAIRVSGGRVDIRGLPSGGASSGRPMGPISGRLDRVDVSDTIHLRNVAVETTGGSTLRGAFSGLLNGEAAVDGTLSPLNGRTRIDLRSRQAGRIIKSLGFSDASDAGTLQMALTPTQGPGVFNGYVKIEDIRIQNAPVMAEVFNALSIVGLLDQLNGPGISFSDVTAEFRVTPDQIIVGESSAVGPAMGISLDGVYDLASRQMDFQGALSPLYVVNAIGRIVAKKGEGLIAFNYNLRGTPDNMRVSVNPLSALTPGFLREIFRRPAPNLEE